MTSSSVVSCMMCFRNRALGLPFRTASLATGRCSFLQAAAVWLEWKAPNGGVGSHDRALRSTWDTIGQVIVDLPDAVPVDRRAICLEQIRYVNDD